MGLAALLVTAGLALAQPDASAQDPHLLAQEYAAAEALQMDPVLVGCVASACFGPPGCLGIAMYYASTDAPLPDTPLAEDPLFLQIYDREMRRRRARWAVLGGVAGAAALVGGTAALTVGGMLFSGTL